MNAEVLQKQSFILPYVCEHLIGTISDDDWDQEQYYYQWTLKGLIIIKYSWPLNNAEVRAPTYMQWKILI